MAAANALNAIFQFALARILEPAGRRRRTLSRLRRGLQTIRGRDYFPPPERELAVQAVEELAAQVVPAP